VDAWEARVGRFLLRATLDAVVVLEEGRVAACNLAASRVLGCDSVALRGRPGDEVLVEVGGAGVVARALAGDEVDGADTCLLRRDGTEVPVRLVSTRLDGAVAVLLHDESERRETQRALADAREQLRDLQVLGDVGVWRWLPATDEVEWSEHLYRIHGVDPLTFGRTLSDHLAVVRADLRGEVAAGLRAAAEGTATFEQEYAIVRGDGEQRWVYGRATPMPDAQGRVGVLTGVAQDVTDARRARTEIESTNARLQRFASVLAHDLREPLVAIDGFSSLLVERAELADEPALFAGRIRANSTRALELLSSILADARGTGGSPSGRVELDEVVAWVLDALDDRIDRTGASVTTDPLPAVRGDESLLRQALLNLVANALKFGGDERGVRVHVSAVETDAGVELRVDDAGPGVLPADREAIFEEGVRAQREVDRGIDGTGIGLATVREIARRHGGDVAVGDADLGGARFVLRLSSDSSAAGSRSM
jgi:PAS domain S-box-containing protein